MCTYKKVTPMNPADVQILFADLQPDIVARSKTNPPHALARSAGVLAEVAGLLRLPSISAWCRTAERHRSSSRNSLGTPGA